VSNQLDSNRPGPSWATVALVLVCLLVGLAGGVAIGYSLRGPTFLPCGSPPEIASSLEAGKTASAKWQMKVIRAACQEYQLHHGEWPASLEVLLVPEPANDGAPYFGDVKYLADPWGHAYTYAVDGAGPIIGCKTAEGKVITTRTK
jgi:hypothetical protein